MYGRLCRCLIFYPSERYNSIWPITNIFIFVLYNLYLLKYTTDILILLAHPQEKWR